MTRNDTFYVVFLPTYGKGHELIEVSYYFSISTQSLCWVIFHRLFYLLSNYVWCFKWVWGWNWLHAMYCHTSSLAGSETSAVEWIYTYWCTFRSRLLRGYSLYYMGESRLDYFCILIRRLWIFNAVALDG